MHLCKERQQCVRLRNAKRLLRVERLVASRLPEFAHTFSFLLSTLRNSKCMMASSSAGKITTSLHRLLLSKLGSSFHAPCVPLTPSSSSSRVILTLRANKFDGRERRESERKERGSTTPASARPGSHALLCLIG